MRYDIWNFGSSSEGNCFIVKHKSREKALMLECGLPMYSLKKRWKETLDAPFTDTVLISHEHLDHCKIWQSIYDLGGDAFASNGTANAIRNADNRILRLKEHEWQKVPSYETSYEVFPLRSNHDAAEPFMYLIRAPKTEDILLFAIDTADIPYDLHQFNITDMLVECNYSESNISPDMDPIRMERVRNTHMSLETLTEFFEKQKFPNLQQITLCHLSQSNCDPKKAKETIMAATGIPVRVCAAKGGFIDN